MTMMGRTHLILSTGVTLSLLELNGQSITLPIAAVTVIGVAPWNYAVGGLLVGCTFLPHRGLTHTFYGVGVWSGLLYGASIGHDPNIWIAGGVSYLLHLLADSITVHGIRPLPPLKIRLRLPLMTTGGYTGYAVEGVAIFLTLVLLWFSFGDKLSLPI